MRGKVVEKKHAGQSTPPTEAGRFRRSTDRYHTHKRTILKSLTTGICYLYYRHIEAIVLCIRTQVRFTNIKTPR